MANWSWESALGDRRSIPFDRAGAGLLLSQFPVSAGLRPQFLQTRRKCRNHRFLLAFFRKPPKRRRWQMQQGGFEEVSRLSRRTNGWKPDDTTANFSFATERKSPAGGKTMHIKYGKSAQGPRTGGIFTPSVRGSCGQAIQGCRTKNRLLQLPIMTAATYHTHIIIMVSARQLISDLCFTAPDGAWPRQSAALRPRAGRPR